MPSVSISTLVLKNHGPLDLREITQLTALRVGKSLKYENVHAVLLREQEAGRVTRVMETRDYRTDVWEAT